MFRWYVPFIFSPIVALLSYFLGEDQPWTVMTGSFIGAFLVIATVRLSGVLKDKS